MPLTMRPTGLASPVDRRQDYTVYRGKWAIGRIYQERGMPAEMQWFWSFHGSVSSSYDMRTNGHAPTLEAAKGELATCWHKWLAWAKLGETE
jgi:hypothetical protein